MFKKILVAVDRSLPAQQALKRATAIAKAFDSSIMLVHVLSSDDGEVLHPMVLTPGLDYTYSDPELLRTYRQRWQEYEENSLTYLQGLGAELAEEGVTAEWSQPTGSPSRSICSLAQSWEADLIVMGRRGRSGITEWILGSVSNYVTHHAPCAVLLVGPTDRAPSPEGTTPAEGVVTPTDFVKPPNTSTSPVEASTPSAVATK